MPHGEGCPQTTRTTRTGTTGRPSSTSRSQQAADTPLGTSARRLALRHGPFPSGTADAHRRHRAGVPARHFALLEFHSSNQGPTFSSRNQSRRPRKQDPPRAVGMTFSKDPMAPLAEFLVSVHKETGAIQPGCSQPLDSLRTPGPAGAAHCPRASVPGALTDGRRVPQGERASPECCVLEGTETLQVVQPPGPEPGLTAAALTARGTSLGSQRVSASVSTSSMRSNSSAPRGWSPPPHRLCTPLPHSRPGSPSSLGASCPAVGPQ